MVYKRIIYSLLYSKGFFHLSRNFRLQQVGDVEWLKNNFGFGETCDHIDELMIILVTKNPDENEIINYFKDVKKLKEKIFVPLILGGGIRTFDQARNCFSNGADKILINQLAHEKNEIVNKVAKVYGEQAVTLMVDYKKIENINYSFSNSAEKKSMALKDYFENIKNLNFGEIIINSIEKDGSAQGLNLDCLKDLTINFNKPVLLMGGAGKPDHFISTLKKKEVSGIVTANLFNFLGDGLKKARSFSIDKGIRLIEFQNIQ
tara:strand:- start:30 stop:812 length:783 start_codon:yes stop_codon:yes gene_type:complete